MGLKPLTALEDPRCQPGLDKQTQYVEDNEEEDSCSD